MIRACWDQVVEQRPPFATVLRKLDSFMPAKQRAEAKPLSVVEDNAVVQSLSKNDLKQAPRRPHAQSPQLGPLS